MPSRLALVNCREPNEGPWTIAKGNESKVQIFGLGQGEFVHLEFETAGGREILGFECEGIHPWPDLEVGRYRVCKTVTGPVKSPTTVRILLNGNH